MEDDFNISPEDGDTNVRVAVRCRPFNSREKGMSDTTKCINIKGEQVIIIGPSGEEHSFAFDCVFDDRSTQPEVWENIGLPILEKAFSGYNGTIFAYGQTGSGKTWSMQGAEGELEGVIPRMNKAVFERISSQKSMNSNLQFLVTASYFELYNEVIFDLLDPTDRKKRSKSGLEIKEHPVLGVYVKGLQEIVVDSPSKMQALIDQGMHSRTVASTQMNAESSRSHSVFTIKVHQKDSEDESKNLFAKVNLVDLAGSERVKSTGATGATLKEGANINKSLSALGNVINALVECAKGKKGVFVPYRNSKLTRVLQESLGGNSITVMIAALSPALCNFEETLSTLKYANRAKAIKVKAIKNDESSQISRLNEEIRMLKEKLVTQKTTVDTSLLEEKHQQQLRDLEEAMKSTWEEKARVSADHEKERIRLEREQQQFQQQLSQQREDNWRLLETKGDMDLSITHLKDLLRIVQPEGGVDRIGAWTSDLRDIIKLESELSEQYTVIDVYQSSLLRDSESLLREKKNNANIMGDKIAVGQWKQLRDKFQVIHSECNKWVNIRSKLMNSIENFLTTISSAQSQWQESQAENASTLEVSQVSRGFNLIQKQVQEKHQKFVKISSKIVNVVSGFNNVADKMLLILQGNKQRLDSIENNKSTDETEKDYQQERQKIVSDILNISKELKTFFTSNGTLSNFVANGLFGREKKDSETQTNEISNQLQESIIQVYENISCSNRTTIKKAGIDSDESWIISTLSNVRSESDLPYIQISLPEVQHLSNLMIQGGVIPQEMQMIKSDSSSVSNGLNHKKFTLPCNYGLDNCNGSIENTIPMLADIISWETLIKKNPPEKFLARPPVKFLFDLINYVVRTTNIPVYQTNEEVNWDIIGSSKENKMLFIDKILNYVANCLKIPSPTTSASIVSGADGNLTNIFLQHLSIVGYCHKNNISLDSILLPPPQVSPRAVERLEKENLKLRETWIEKIRIGISYDGINFTNSSDLNTNLNGCNEIKKIDLNKIFQENLLKTVKSIRIYAVSWSGQMTSLRFNLSSLKQTNLMNSINTNENLTNEFQKLFYGLILLRNSSNFLSITLNHLNIIQELEVTRKQEEVRKKMENLADEKLFLEQKLANEKLALSNEKESLEEQLRTAVSKLKEAEELLAQEKSINLQLKNLHQDIVSENQSLQLSLQQQMDENNSLQSQLLMLQANNERDSIIMEGYRKKIDEDNEKINQLSKEIDEYKNLQLQWTTEHDDFLNQIEILTEERDSARQNEEELYSVLKEKINDLERLQESYVDMTDRCNDYQDTMADMREEMESLKDMMLVESRQFISSQSNPVLRSRSISEPTKEAITESPQTIENITNSLSSNSSPRYEYKSQEQTINKPINELSSSQISLHSQTQSQPPSQRSQKSPRSPRSQGKNQELTERPSTSQVEDDNNYNDDNFEDDFEDDFES